MANESVLKVGDLVRLNLKGSPVMIVAKVRQRLAADFDSQIEQKQGFGGTLLQGGPYTAPEDRPKHYVAICQWFNGRQLCESAFPAESLSVTEDF